MPQGDQSDYKCNLRNKRNKWEVEVVKCKYDLTVNEKNTDDLIEQNIHDSVSSKCIVIIQYIIVTN